MKSENVKIPFILLLLLCATSFVPLVQISAMQVHGNLMNRFFEITAHSNIEAYVLANLMSGSLALLAYFLAQKIAFKFLRAGISVFFLQFFFFVELNEVDLSDYGYFMPFLFFGFLGTLPLIVVGFMKEKWEIKNQSS